VIEVELRRITINDTGDKQYITLGEKGGDRNLTIVIGYHEAQAVDRFVKGLTLARPMTHDLAVALLGAAGAEIDRVEVTRLHEGTFYAIIHLRRQDGVVVEVDARPSDAIALATALERPVFIAEDVMDEAALT
jgi:bifunctional DNase/RNase